MKGLELIEAEWNLGSLFGIENTFLQITQKTVITTWCILIALCIIILLMRKALSYRFGRFCIVSTIRFFMNLTTQALGTFSYTHFCFITAIFVYILLCNLSALIPWVEEPTKDLNTTLALGCVTFLHRQIVTIRTHGIRAYMQEYFEPFFIMLPLNIIGKFASIISISFRLFGNIFGGAIIMDLYFQALEGSIPLMLIMDLSGTTIAIMTFFIIFEGSLQAFVFTMLTLTYLSISIQGEGGH